MTILSGSLVLYGLRWDGGGVVREVEYEAAYDDSEYTEEGDFACIGFLGLSYGRKEKESSSVSR